MSFGDLEEAVGVHVRRRFAAIMVAVSVVFLIMPAPVHAHTDAPGAARQPTSSVVYDSRTAIASARSIAVATARARMALGRSLGPMGVFELDRRTGTARVVARLNGYLTAPSTLSPERVVMDYVRHYLAAFGLSSDDLPTFTLRQDVVDIDGVHHLSFTQAVGGVQAFDNGLLASVTPNGRLLTLTGSPAHALGAGLTSLRPSVSSGSAIGRARTTVGAGSTPRRGDTARLVLFHGGRSTLAWQTLTTISPEERDLTVVDADTGAILWRVNLVDNATGTGLAWDYYPSDQVPGLGGTQQPVSFPVRDGSRLSGPYAHVYTDVFDDNVAGPADEIAALTGLDWSAPAILDTTTTAQNCASAHACTWDRTLARSWQQNLRQNAVQVYVYLNRFHDFLAAAPIGFDAARGNFERAGHDAVRAQVFDGASTDQGLPDRYHYNNANMYAPPDGHAPVMQMYLFRRNRSVPGWPSANAGDDASIVYHEYTHGLSSRLVTYPNGTQALNSQQSGAMGEAWSDWYALDLLVQDGMIVDTTSSGQVTEGQWITGGEGVRYQAIDCAVGASSGVCPSASSTGAGGFTYGDYGKVYPGPEIHSDGEIWAQTLWDIRRALGATLAEKLVTRAMQLSPPDPSFLDMRDAILLADVHYDGKAHLDMLWGIFAHRGMGYFASTIDGDDVHPVENFSKPPSCDVDPCGSIRGRLTDSITGRPVARVMVSVGGHDAGLPGTNLVDRTGRDGRYVIRKVPFHRYPDLVFDRWGLEPIVVHGVTVDGIERIDRSVNRDWAALDGGATIHSFTRPDYSSVGCGPSGALDRSLVTGWSSDAPRAAYGSSVTGPRSLVVTLPKTIDVTSFGVDAGATCGDAHSASTRAFDIFTRTVGGSWIRAVHVTSGAVTGSLGRYLPTAGTRRVHWVKLVLRANRGDPVFMDLSEFSVRGRRP